MRNSNFKNLMNGMLFGVLVVMLMIATVGCDKKKSNNNGFRHCQPGQFCQNPGGFPGQPGFGNGVVGFGYDTNSGSQVYLEFVSQQGQFGGSCYVSGQTYVYGQIDTNGINCQNGGYIPADSYELSSQFPANAQNGVVGNTQLVGYGYYGDQITVSVSFATMQCPMGGFYNGEHLPLSASLTITSVNGMPCNAFMGVQP